MANSHWLQPVLEPLRPALHRVAEERGGLLGRRLGAVTRDASWTLACLADRGTRFLLSARPRTAAETLTLQGERLHDLVTYAERWVPHWRDALATAGVSASEVTAAEHVRRIPLLRKEHLRGSARERLRSADPARRRAALYETSGSSGEPTRVFVDWQLRTLRKRARMRMLLDNGVLPGDRLLYLWRKKSLEADDLISFLCGDLVRIDALDVADARATGLDRDAALGLLARIERADPTVLRSYAHVLDVLVTLYARHRRSFHIRPKVVWSCGEVLPPSSAEAIADVFGARVLDHYGSTEADPIAYTMPGHEGAESGGMVVCEDLMIVELLDENDAPVQGGPGRVVVTDLFARAFPVLRYDTGDLAEWAPASRPGARVLSRLRGRHNDMVVLPGGRLVLPDAWYVHLREGNADWLERFQVEQRDVDDIIVRLAVNDSFREEALVALQARVAASWGRDVQVSWEIGADIPASANGKLRHVVSHVDADALVGSW